MLPPVAFTERDGVPVVHVPGAPDEAVVAAGLVLRVGQADETLATRGITHLLEHLVAEELGLDGLRAEVTDTHLRFAVLGERDEVLARLTRLCALLADPPTARIDHERRILRIEDDRDDPVTEARLLADRFGARGPGLPAWPEFGLRWVGPEDVRRWAGERCHAGAACAWTTTAAPEDLRLPLAPARAAAAPPTLAPRGGLAFPATLTGIDGQVALGAVFPVGDAGALLSELVHRRLMARLRRELALTYSVDVRATALPGASHLFAVVDAADPTVAATARDELAAAVRALAATGPEAEELAGAKRSVTRLLDHDERRSSVLQAMAQRVLRGEWAEPSATVAAMGAAEVQRAAQAAWASTLVRVPTGTRDAGWARAPAAGSVTAVDAGLDAAPPDGRAVLVSDGLFAVLPGAGPALVRADRAAALVEDHDGTFAVFDADGCWMRLFREDLAEPGFAAAVRERFAHAPVIPPDPLTAPPPPPPAAPWASGGGAWTAGGGRVTFRPTPPRGG